MDEEETFYGYSTSCLFLLERCMKFLIIILFEGLKWILAGIFINLINHGGGERERERLPSFLPCKMGGSGLNSVQWTLMYSYVFIIFLNIQNGSVSAKLPNMFIMFAQDHESCMMLSGIPMNYWVIYMTMTACTSFFLNPSYI